MLLRLSRAFDAAAMMLVILFVVAVLFNIMVVEPNAPLPERDIYNYVEHIEKHDNNIVNVVVDQNKQIVILVVNDILPVNQQYAQQMCSVIHQSGLQQVELLRIIDRDDFGRGSFMGHSMFSMDYSTVALALCHNQP